MSQENVELLRRFIEAFNRGDLEAALALADAPPEFEFVPSGVLIPDLASVQRGPEGLRQVAEVFWAEFDDPHVEVHELIDAGDRVFTSQTFRGRGKQSGAETSWNTWSVWTVRDGKIVRWQGFTDQDAALEAAGLSEQAMSQENVENYRRAAAAWARGDLDAALAFADEDAEIISRVFVMEGSYRGHEGVRRWWQDLHDSFPDWDAEVGEVRALGDATLARLHVRAHGGESGVPVEQTMWHLAHWRNGRMVRLSSHGSEAEALEAAGLSE